MKSEKEVMKEIIQEFYKKIADESDKRFDNERDRRSFHLGILANTFSLGASLTSNKQYGAFAYAGNVLDTLEAVIENCRERMFDEFAKQAGIPDKSDSEDSKESFVALLKILKAAVDKK